MSDLFSADILVRLFFAIVIVLALFGVTVWMARRFGVERLGGSGPRGRQVRLAVIEDVEIQGRRRLVLIRRDNVEHLLMIGGPTDLVVEPNIVRAAAAREAAPPVRAAAAGDARARAPAADHGQWPLQAEPAAHRPPRIAVPPTPHEEHAQWPAEPELPTPAPPSPPRRRAPDPLAGLAAELSRSPDGARAPAPVDLGAAAFVAREPLRHREAGRPRDMEPEREPREREPMREVMREREPPMREREAAQEATALRVRELMREREAAHEPTPLRVRELMRVRELIREPEPVRESEPVREPEPAREPELVREPEPIQEPEHELPIAREPIHEQREVAQLREAAPPAPVEAEREYDASADQNLADMAQRLEAALRRPARVSEARPTDAAARAMTAELEAARAPAAASSPLRGELKPTKSVYDSLEKEMASLLGRPSGKS